MDEAASPDPSPGRAGDRARAERLRVVVHMSLSLSLVYYLVPDPLPLAGVPRGTAAIGLALAVSLAEALRIGTGWTFFLFRDYERHRPAAYYWLGLGCCLALVFFPARFAVLTVLGVCFADPVIGAVRQTAYKQSASAFGALTWAGVGAAAVVFGNLSVPWWLLLGGAGTAVLAEAKRIPYIDDDFLMNIVPLAALTFWASALQV